MQWWAWYLLSIVVLWNIAEDKKCAPNENGSESDKTLSQFGRRPRDKGEAESSRLHIDVNV